MPEQIAAAPTDLRGLISWFRATTTAVEAETGAWQLGIDALRPHIRDLWTRLSAEDRSRFVKKVRPFWEVLRHRAPSDMIDLVDTLKARGELEIVAGSLGACVPGARGLEVEIMHRSGPIESRRFDAIVRCIGPALESSELGVPLLADLIDRGVARLDAANLGIVTAENGALVDAAGQASSRLFALGALRRPSEWEATSVPEIAVQARDLARALLS